LLLQAGWLRARDFRKRGPTFRSSSSVALTVAPVARLARDKTGGSRRRPVSSDGSGGTVFEPARGRTGMAPRVRQKQGWGSSAREQAEDAGGCRHRLWRSSLTTSGFQI
jgi:hypothetical protein